MLQDQSKAYNIFFARFESLQIFMTVGVNEFFLHKYIMCGAVYDVIYQPFLISSQYLKMWEVDSPVHVV